MRRLISVLIALGLLAITPSLALAWGAEGHVVVAQVAYSRLTPHAQARLNQIITDGNGWVNAKYAGRCQINGLNDAATWPDCVRPNWPESGPWHYDDVDLCKTPRLRPDGWMSSFDRPYCSKSGCATKALQKYIKALGARSTTPGDRLIALSFVIHLIGDIHQPMHAEESDGDRGGNDVKVQVAPGALSAGGPSLRDQPNLHGLWDTQLVYAAIGPTLPGVGLISDLAKTLPASTAGGTPDAWMLEAHENARAAYAQLEPRLACDIHPSGVETMTADYVAQQSAVVRQQLAKAAVRLASTLNQALAY